MQIASIGDEFIEMLNSALRKKFEKEKKNISICFLMEILPRGLSVKNPLKHATLHDSIAFNKPFWWQNQILKMRKEKKNQEKKKKKKASKQIMDWILTEWKS